MLCVVRRLVNCFRVGAGGQQKLERSKLMDAYVSEVLGASMRRFSNLLVCLFPVILPIIWLLIYFAPTTFDSERHLSPRRQQRLIDSNVNATSYRSSLSGECDGPWRPPSSAA